MKIHPQIISQKGMPAFAVLPYSEYEKVLEIIENLQDIEAVKAVQLDQNEHFPLDLVERIAAGEHPIKAFREYRGISQTELAKKVNVSRQYISQIEAGDRAGSTKLLKVIATVLDVELDDIV